MLLPDQTVLEISSHERGKLNLTCAPNNCSTVSELEHNGSMMGFILHPSTSWSS